ncbi:polysaccharide lyase family 1 protein [Mycena olivaceomarginata]|nr:polysaccharide lyase family 1 protein [Mycena olivaceomarginata]
MKFSQLTVAFVASSVHVASAAISSVVTGVPVGFASGTTGGGTVAAVIVISGTFNFAGSEGTQALTACNAYACTPSNGGQALLNTLNGCTQPTYGVTIDTAAYQGINVASDKTLVGTNGATLNGKGLRFVNVNNIIIQNIKIQNLNPQYVWGGDAITLSGTNNIWIDHVTTSNLGRQHYFVWPHCQHGTPNSATCNGHSYWGLELVGGGDFITFYRNWVYFTSGRSPALSGTTLFHAVNNVWSSNAGHLIEGDKNGMGLYEGNYFLDTPTIVASGSVVALFSSEPAALTQCQASLGRSCVANLLGTGSATSFNYDTTSFLTKFAGHNIPPASNPASVATSVINGAGNTL